MNPGLLKRFTEEVLKRTPVQPDNSVAVVSEVATLTDDGPHGRTAGERITLSGAANALLNGTRTILDTPSATTLIFPATGVADGPDGNNGAINYYQTGVDVIKANPYAASPEKPYVAVRVFSDDDLGFPVSEVVSQSPSEVDQQVSTVNIAQCELIFYSNFTTGEFSAQNLAKFFITALGFSRASQFQHDNNFGVLQVRPRINADIHMGDFVERRQVVEFSVNYIYTITEEDVPFFNADGFIVTLEIEN